MEQIFDDGYGTVRGNDNPVVMQLRKPLQVVETNMGFPQAVGTGNYGLPTKLIVGVGAVLLIIFLLDRDASKGEK
jgi:hypothetical protein